MAQTTNNFIMLPTILPAEYSDDKLGILDVAVLLRDGTQIDMEMQVVYFTYWTNRVLFYLCRMYAGQLKKGDSYNKLKKCIHVSLLDFVHFPEDKKCYHKISLCDTKNGKLYTDLMELHILELRKLPKKVRNEDSITRWMRFFNGKTRKDFREMAESDKYIHEAFSELEKLSADERKRLEYEAREKAVRDYNCLMDSAQELGLEQGLRQKVKEHTQKMLRRGMSPSEIADLLGEDPQLIASVAAELQQEPQDS